jgi:hypothetical protein
MSAAGAYDVIVISAGAGGMAAAAERALCGPGITLGPAPTFGYIAGRHLVQTRALPDQVESESALVVLYLSHFLTESRCPPFRKML